MIGPSTCGRNYAEALSNRGNILLELKRFEEALASYDRAITAPAGLCGGLSSRGVALHEFDRLEEAVTSYDRAIAVRPDDADAL